jgi:RNA polymerase sigma-70 factor, ECF subfamily
VSVEPPFLEVSGAARKGRVSSELEDTLRQLWATGRGAWPTVELPLERFVRHLAERLAAESDPAAVLGAIHAADLYLACACVAGDREALALFHERFLVSIVSFVARKESLRELPEDFRQILGEHLLVPVDGGLPRLAGYAGRGPLAAWLRVVGLRTALNLSKRAEKSTETLGHEALSLAATAPHPELALLRVQCRDEFRDAFQAALAALEPRERNVLRFHFLRGLTSEEVARMHGVSRRTVHRWLEEAREKLLKQTRSGLARRMAIPPKDLQSVMHALQSDLRSTVARHLDDSEGG